MFKDNNLPILNLPQFDVRLKNEGTKLVIFDVLRKKFVVLTPEEWVRQHFIHFLMNTLQYPSGKIGNEIEIKLHGLSKRCDSVIYNNFGQPVAIVEYKAPKIEMKQIVFDQIFSYNLKLKVPYLILSNGIQHFACKIVDNQPVFLQKIPSYSEICHIQQ